MTVAAETTGKVTRSKNTAFTEVKDRIFCNGSTDQYGHPGVYLAISADKDYVECPYCDCRFIYKEKKAK